MKLLIVVPTVDPASGGPAESVQKRGAHLGKQGDRMEVLTMDDPAESFVQTYSLPVHALGPSLTEIGRAHV